MDARESYLRHFTHSVGIHRAKRRLFVNRQILKPNRTIFFAGTNHDYATTKLKVDNRLENVGLHADIDLKCPCRIAPRLSCSSDCCQVKDDVGAGSIQDKLDNGQTGEFCRVQIHLIAEPSDVVIGAIDCARDTPVCMCEQVFGKVATHKPRNACD
jgi:hypothetical protein